MAGPEAGLCQPQAAQPNPGLDPAAGKITHGLNFQAARFLGHAATSAGFGGIEILGMMSSAGWSGLWPRMKSAAFCACAAAWTMSVLSSFNCFSQPSRYSV